MSDEVPLEAILPEETIAKIREIVREALSQPPQATIGAKAALSAKAQVIDLEGKAIAQIVASGWLDVAESKRLWESPLGQIMINLFGTFLIAFYTQLWSDLSAQQNEERKEKFERELQRQFEEFLHNEFHPPQPTQKPTPAEPHPPSQTFT